MKPHVHHALAILLFIFMAPFLSKAQEPDLSAIKNDNEKIKVWTNYCESLRLNNKGIKNNYALLQQAALKGITLTSANDAAGRSKFFYYAAFGAYYQVKFDSAQYYFYKCLHEAQRANSAEFIASACVALIPVNFQLQQQDKVDSCKDILQSILDTTHNQKILRDGYSAMGSYYQQKSFYSTAQDYLLKSVSLRKKEVDTTSDLKLKADYAIQCYLLSKQYENTDVLDKSLAVLKEGLPFSNASPLVITRYLSSFTEVYAQMGNIDSALHYESLLEEFTKNSPVVPSEMVSANMNIAKYYLDHGQSDKAFSFVTKADTLAAKSKSPILIYQAQLIKGRYFEETGKFAQAISLFTQSLPVARQISREQYVDELKYMAVTEKEYGHMDSAVDYYRQYTSESDSLTKEKISRNFADQETRYQTNQKELRISSLNKENRLNVLELQNASRTRLLLILGLVALGVIALLLYFIYRNKEKVNQVLNKQKKQLEELNGSLSVANETKAKLFGIISHDLRSPVSQIVQLLQLQKEKSTLLNEQSMKYHEQQIKNASENVLETMEDLLLWSKSQMQHFTPQVIPVKLSGTIKKELNLLNERIENKNLKVNNEVAENLMIKTDENFISVIIRNLLQNAVKYSNDNSIISISADEKNIFITNESSLTNKETLNALLQNKQVGSGTSGLGLQIANDLAASIGARISFDQKNNNTVTATINLAV